MIGSFDFTARIARLALLSAALVGCASPPHRAPVEERSAAPRSASTPPSAPMPAAAPGTVGAVDTPKPPTGIENLGKPGYYAIKPGDTLMRIGLESGQNWRDIARWNNLENANVLEVGQVLRVVPPGADPSATAARPVAGTSGRIEARPLDAPRAASAPVNATPVPGAPAVAAAPAPAPAPAAVRDGDDDIAWSWPTSSAVVVPFDDARSKGLVFTGKAGDPVLAAADGRVIYAGSGLRGYGNMVIVKHNSSYLTAYAHNQALLVKEDQAVRRGQKIAEMGSSDAERVQLHFEIRRLGKPVDPSKLLPAR
jgi:lipoprotein NlpD